MFGSKQKNAGAPKLQFSDKMMALGGLLRDTGGQGTNHFGAAMGANQNKLARMQEKAEQERRQADIAAATQGMSPQQAALARLNPQFFSQRGLSNAMQDPLAVRGADRADALASNTIQNTQFNQGMATDKFGYQQERDGVNDEFREKSFDRGVFESDRGYGLQKDGQQFNQMDANRRFGLAEQGQGFNQDMAMANYGLAAQKANAPAKPPTFNGQMSQAAGFLNRAKGASKIIGALENEGFSIGRAKKVPFRGGEQRSYEAAQDEWIGAILRKESGAAIGKEERETFAKQYFPQPFDNEDVKKQKAAARARAEESLYGESQGAYDAMFGGNEGAPKKISINDFSEDEIQAERRRRGLIQ